MKIKLLILLICMSAASTCFAQNSMNSEAQSVLPEDDQTDGRISLRLAGNGSFMTILIGFIPEGTVNYDDGFDGHFINDGAAIEFYSFMGTTRLSIQALPELQNTNVQVPLGYQITSDGTYTISIDAEFLDPTFDIILEDTYDATFTDLRQTAYTFSGITGEIHDRFYLNLDKQEALTVESIQKEKEIQAYFTSNTLHIHTEQANFKKISLFNMLGKPILQTNFKQKIVVNSLPKGVYILRCTDISGAVISKKIIK